MLRPLCRIAALASLALLSGCGGTLLQEPGPTINLVVIGQVGSNVGVYATDNKGSFVKQLVSFTPDILFASDLCRANDGTIACWSWNGLTGASTAIIIRPDGTVLTIPLPIMPQGFALSPDGKSYCISSINGPEWNLYLGPVGGALALFYNQPVSLSPVLWVPNTGIVFDVSPGNSFATLALPSTTSSATTTLSTERLGGRGFSSDGSTWIYGTLLQDGSTDLTLAPVGKPGKVINHFTYRNSANPADGPIVLDLAKQHAIYAPDTASTTTNDLVDYNLQTRRYRQFKLPGITNINWIVESGS